MIQFKFAKSFLISAIAFSVLALLLFQIPGPDIVRAKPAGDVTINVTMSGAPVSNAFVALVGANGQFVGTTNNSGQAVIANVPDGSYTVSASAPGTTVVTTTLSVSTALSASVVVTDSGNKFKGVGIYGASLGGIMTNLSTGVSNTVGIVIPDGKSGTFYINAISIPSLWRTTDYGGSWSPATISTDDLQNGIEGRVYPTQITSSKFPGEIAAFVGTIPGGNYNSGSYLYYSRDFGVTWNRIAAPNGVSFAWDTRTRMLWGHRNNISVVLIYSNNDTTMYYANMPTSLNPSSPVTWQPLNPSFKLSAGDKLFIANGENAPTLAVASANGNSVTLYEITSTPATTAANIVLSGVALNGAPRLVLLGGSNTGPQLGTGNIPNTLVIYGETPVDAKMSSYSSGSWTTTTTTEFYFWGNETIDPNGSFEKYCNNSGSVTASIPRGGSVISSTAALGTCWLTKNGGTLQVRAIGGPSSGVGLAFDADYGRTLGSDIDLVVLGADLKGPLKSSQSSANRPLFEPFPKLAASGILPNSNGVSLNGIDAANITDIVYGRTALDVAVNLAAGDRTYGSSDGGKTWSLLKPKPGESYGGGQSIEWWTGSSGKDWILSGTHGGFGEILAAANLNGSITSSTTLRSIPNITASDFYSGVPPNNVFLWRIAGNPNTDSAFIGFTTLGANIFNSYGGIRRVSLFENTGIITGTISNPGFTDIIGGGIVGLAYCPSGNGSPVSVADKLFVGWTRQGGQIGGGINVYSNVSGSPTSASIALPGGVRAIKASCPSGVVYAATETGLYKSTDGSSFSKVTFNTTNSNLNNRFLYALSALAVDRANGNKIIVVDVAGDFVSSADGGITWIIKNDTDQSTAKFFGFVNDVEIPPSGASSSPARPAASRANPRTGIFQLFLPLVMNIFPDPAIFNRVLLGGGDGLYRADLLAK